MKAKGSITVFATLVIMLVASFLFALLEAGRTQGLATRADMISRLSIESVCAEYQPGLWEDYHLLCLDGAYGGGTFSMEYVSSTLHERIKRNFSGENSLFHMSLEDASPREYQLLTDGDGTVFLKRVAEYMKDNLPAEAAKLIYEKYMQGEDVEQEGLAGDSVEAAQKAIDDAKDQLEGGAENQDTNGQMQTMENPSGEAAEITQQESSAEIRNPLEIVLKIKEKAILGLVLEDTGDLSTKQVDSTDSLQKRVCIRGTETDEKNITWYDKVLVLEYLDGYFSDYMEPAEEHALAYEMEYVLCGKETDSANLEGTINRLLMVREAANVVHILADAGKREQSLLVATALAGFTGNPAIIKVVQIGVIAAWAYVESRLDVRA